MLLQLAQQGRRRCCGDGFEHALGWGVRDLTLSDYPGQPATVMFFRGCNMSWLLSQRRQCMRGATFSDATCVGAFAARRHRVPGVVPSGGEPTMHAGLPCWRGTANKG